MKATGYQFSGIVPPVLAFAGHSTTYQFVLLLHILAAIVAFGPLFFYPALLRNGERTTVASLHMKLVFPALTLLWVLGMGLAGIGKFDLAETTWMGASVVVWLIAMIVSWFLIRPAIKDDGEGAQAKLSAGIGVTHLLLIIALYLMVFQPGGSVFK